jgi:hypothetical protein
MSLRLVMPKSTIDEGLSVRSLAGRMADELYALATGVDDCQLAVEDILDRGLTRDDMVRLQALDAISQTIGEVAGVLERLAASGELGAASAALLDPVRLSDLRRRLLGDADKAPATGGEPELW